MTLEALLATVVLEYKYNYDPSTKNMLVSLYERTTGKSPTARTNLLRWFLTTYEFDGVGTWYHKDRILPN